MTMNMNGCFALLAFLSALFFSAPVAANESYVWWEGEAAFEHNFSNTHFSASWLPRSDQLSGGDWLNNGGKADAAARFARYRVNVPTAGVYGFWTRKFWKHGPFRYRFDQGEWRRCGRDVALHDNFEFKTHICANWIYLGEVRLAPGEHLFELELEVEPGDDAVACFDCFLLVQEPFSPSGKLRPGEKRGLAKPGWWAFEPDVDGFADSAMLDLSELNEEQAGMHGFVRAAGDGLAGGDGRPLRFWGVNAGADMVNLCAGHVDYLARSLAKRGVNLVRIHAAVFDQDSPDMGMVD